MVPEGKSQLAIINELFYQSMESQVFFYSFFPSALFGNFNLKLLFNT